jgi:hypothetical protein
MSISRRLCPCAWPLVELCWTDILGARRHGWQADHSQVQRKLFSERSLPSLELGCEHNCVYVPSGWWVCARLDCGCCE